GGHRSRPPRRLERRGRHRAHPPSVPPGSRAVKGPRSHCGGALLFAEKAGCGQAWREALRGWDVTESQIVNEWTAPARAGARAEGERKAKAEAVVRVLQAKFGQVPERLGQAIRAVKESDRLDGWIDLAARARSLS